METKVTLERKSCGHECLQEVEKYLKSKLERSALIPLSDIEKSEIDDWWE